MLKKIIYIVIILLNVLLFSNESNAQAEPMYSQYMFNMMSINPAYAGSRNAPSLTALMRNQWLDFPGAPKTSILTFDMPMQNNKLGIAFKLTDDILGVEHTTTVNGAMSSRVSLSEKSTLSVGLEFGLQFYKANLLLVNPFVANDPAFSQNLNGQVPTLGTGVFYNTDKFYIGLSSPNLLKSRLAVDEVNYIRGYAMKELHLFLASGYVFDIGENVKYKPSILIKSVGGAPFQFDLNSTIWLNNILGVGASYRTEDAYVGMLELQVNTSFRIGYAYDKTISHLNQYNQGSLEIMLKMEFGSDKKGIVSPRYF